MGFSTNYTDVIDNDSEYELLPEGKYEVIVESAMSGATKGGTECFGMTFVVRNDVAQKYQNRKIFYRMFKKKMPNDMDLKVGGYSFAQVMRLAKAVNLPSGKSYADIDEMGQDLLKKCLLVEISHREYKGKQYEDVKYINATKFPVCSHKMKETKYNSAISINPPAPTQNNVVPQTDDFTQVEFNSDDDLPF